MKNEFQAWHGEVFASIDLGTNNCRLMIAKPVATGFSVIDSFSKITRLGEGLVSSGELSQKAMERTFKVLEKCADKIKRYPITCHRFVATEACRRAKNGAEFINYVNEKLGLDFEIISPEQESMLSITGCLPFIKPETKSLIVFDIGGGSSEVSISNINKNAEVELLGLISLPLGVLTVSEGFTGTDISGRARKTINDKVNAALAGFDDEYKVKDRIAKGNVQMIGTSGTVTSLGAFHLDLPHYNRSAVDGLTMSFAEVEAARNKLERMSNLERITHPCIGPQRADLTMAGCAILSAICNFFKAEELTVADRGLREGILVDLIRRHKESSGKVEVKKDKGKNK